MLQVKLYSFSGTLIDTISPKSLMNSLSWSAQINGGQSEVRVKLNFPMDTVVDADIVKIFATDSYHPSGKVVYTGVITKIGREIAGGGQYIELTALGIATILGFKLFTNGAKTGTLSNILSDFIDAINASYPLYTKVIDTLSTTGNFDFQNQSILNVVNIIKEAGWSWTIDGAGNFIWRNKTNQTVHNLTLGKNIEKISVIDNTELIKNKINIGWSGGIQTIQDSASITEFGVRELFESNTEITSSTYASSYGQSKIVGVSRTLTIQVYDYDIYSILPGHRVTVRNTPISIQNLQVHKVTYGNEKVTLEVEKIESISDALRN